MRVESQEVSSLLGPVEDAKFAELIAIGKLITDYAAAGAEAGDAAAAAADDALDEEIGVAVEFEDEDESEDDEVDEIVVRA